MSDFTFAVAGGQSLRLKTAGKYCPRDIVVTADTGTAYAKGVADGKQAEYDRFWDAFQENGERTIYDSAFATYWNNQTFNPKYPLRPTQASYMFDACKLENFDFVQREIELDTSSLVTWTYMFRDATGVKRLGVLDFGTESKTPNLNRVFYRCGVETIEEIIVDENTVFDSTFNDAKQLANLNQISGTIGNSIDLHWSPLTMESIQNVMAALSDTAAGMTVSFKKSAVEAAFTTDLWNGLVATKSNWSITLS